MITFTIILCAFNAAGRLGKTLEHICAIDYPVDFFEFILVDNNSTDGTKEFACALWKELNACFPLRIVSESNQGLNHARRRGIQEARFEYVLFCDDDNWLSDQYLKIANTILSQDKSIGVLGGQGIPLTDAERFPNWFYTYNGGFAVGVQGVRSGDVSYRKYVWGACAIARRDILSKVFSAGFELILSGRKAGAMGAGEDSEMCKWFLLAGYKLWYDERMLFHHFIPKERLNLEYLDKLLEGMRNSREVLAYYDEYLQHKVLRRSWFREPVRWLICELRFVLDRRPNKIKVVQLANSIKSVFFS